MQRQSRGREEVATKSSWASRISWFALTTQSIIFMLPRTATTRAGSDPSAGDRLGVATLTRVKFVALITPLVEAGIEWMVSKASFWSRGRVFRSYVAIEHLIAAVRTAKSAVVLWQSRELNQPLEGPSCKQLADLLLPQRGVALCIQAGVDVFLGLLVDLILQLAAPRTKIIYKRLG